MQYHKFGEYDFQQLEQARSLISKVYDFHYGDSYMQKEIKRLETILQKIDYLLTLKKGGAIPPTK